MENVKKISWILLFLGINTCLFSQMKISGIVTDKNNDPLIGVNIRIKGTSTGTITDVDGKYSIQAPDSKSVLVFSYIGFKTTCFFHKIYRNKMNTVALRH